MEALAGALASWPGAELLRGNATAYLLVNATHILGIGLVVGAILPLDLALIGALRQPALGVVAPLASRVAAAGLALAGLTGVTLLGVRPAEYLANPAFLAKLALLPLALGAVLLQHAGAGWRRVVAGAPPSPAVRALALASGLLWLSVLVAGRWIGFV